MTGAKVKDASLLAKDFKAGQLPKGEKGDPGLQGVQGPKGDKGDPGVGTIASLGPFGLGVACRTTARSARSTPRRTAW